MIICSDLLDLNSKVDSPESLSLIYIECKGEKEFLHLGHEYLVEKAKTVSDKVAAIFFLPGIFEVIKNPPGYGWPTYSDAEFDNTGCISWCIENNLDFYLLDSSILKEQVKDFITPDINSQVETLWQNQNYPVYFPEDATSDSIYDIIEFRKSLFYYYEPVKNWMKIYLTHGISNIFVSTWKEGISEFLKKDFIEKYTNSTFHLFDPLDDDGIYFTSVSLDQDQKDIVKMIPQTVDSVGYSNTEILKQQINLLDTKNLGFECYRIEVFSDGVVGNNNDFINVFYRFNEMVDNYAIYKRNVR